MARTQTPAHNHLFLRISGVVYLGLMTNVLVVLAGLPFVALLMTTDPAVSWPLLTLTGILAAPALPAAFSVFAHQATTGDGAVVRPFVAGWRRHATRTLTLSAVAALIIVVLAVDIVWAGQSRVGAVAIPVFATLIALVAVTLVGALVALVDRPDARLRDLLRAALYLMLRRWYLTLASVVCASLLLAIVVDRPAIGLGVTLAPLLYLVWANTRHTITPILPSIV